MNVSSTAHYIKIITFIKYYYIWHELLLLFWFLLVCLFFFFFLQLVHCTDGHYSQFVLLMLYDVMLKSGIKTDRLQK